MSARVHRSCGRQMTAGAFDHKHHSYASQPIWSCHPCGAWEPRDSWDGPLPDGWDASAQQWEAQQ